MLEEYFYFFPTFSNNFFLVYAINPPASILDCRALGSGSIEKDLPLVTLTNLSG